ncbi:MAG: hypothetical protein Q8N18_20010 [Opitutaceae bacterium]|nr:hypothetical protein [Opitutaceae bacterium]
MKAITPRRKAESPPKTIMRIETMRRPHAMAITRGRRFVPQKGGDVALANLNLCCFRDFQATDSKEDERR